MRLDRPSLVAALLVAQLGGSLTALATWSPPAREVTPARAAASAPPARRDAGPRPAAAPTPVPTAPATAAVPPAAGPQSADAAATGRTTDGTTADQPPDVPPARAPAPAGATTTAPPRTASAAAPQPAAAAPAPSSAPPAAAPAPAAAESDRAEYDARLVAGVNAERRSRGLPALRADSCAERYAREHAQRMADQARMHHQDLAPVLDACGADRVGENVGHGDVSPERMVAMWMASASHRATILDPRLTALGSGATRRDDGRWYACHVFLG